LKDKPLLYFKTREHVIPQSFGKFHMNNLVLHKSVCDECNQYFGNNLELFLARDSFEGFSRIQFGIKPKSPLKKRNRFHSKIENGNFKGALIQEMELGEKNLINIDWLPQVGFYHVQKNEYVYFEMNEIPDRDALIEKGFKVENAEIRIIGDENEFNMMIQELKEKGINYLKSEDTILEEIDKNRTVSIVSENIIDKTIMRSICKIAFNYLASQTGNSFILSESFNPLRFFIRYGEGDPNQYFLVNQSPILREDQIIKKYNAKITRGHLIIVEWMENKLFSKISLFNEYTYGINMCADYKGIWIPIRTGHHFDMDTKEVTKLLAISKKLLI
jgi:hypothetical protein